MGLRWMETRRGTRRGDGSDGGDGGDVVPTARSVEPGGRRAAAREAAGMRPQRPTSAECCLIEQKRQGGLQGGGVSEPVDRREMGRLQGREGGELADARYGVVTCVTVGE